MASIVQQNKSFCVVYTIYEGNKKKQKWETYHSYEASITICASSMRIVKSGLSRFLFPS